MSEFKAEFYENGDEIPVKEFLDSLDDKILNGNQTSGRKRQSTKRTLQ